jgi:TfoX/Sxy family transcriptional regulator of competence genes
MVANVRRGNTLWYRVAKPLKVGNPLSRLEVYLISQELLIFSPMPYNEAIADRVREIIAETTDNVEEKRMFGGLCFMVNEKMCICVESERLMIRLDPNMYDELLEKDGCHRMDFTGSVMKGYVFVDNTVLNTKKKLHYWVSLALEYNEIAKASKKRSNK